MDLRLKDQLAKWTQDWEARMVRLEETDGQLAARLGIVEASKAGKESVAEALHRKVFQIIIKRPSRSRASYEAPKGEQGPVGANTRLY